MLGPGVSGRRRSYPAAVGFVASLHSSRCRRSSRRSSHYCRARLASTPHLDADRLLDGRSPSRQRARAALVDAVPLLSASLLSSPPLLSLPPPLSRRTPLLYVVPLLSSSGTSNAVSPILYASLSSPRRHTSSTPLTLLIHPRFRPRRSHRKIAPHALRMRTCFCIGLTVTVWYALEHDVQTLCCA